MNVKWSMKSRQLSNAGAHFHAGNKLITNIPLLKQFDIVNKLIIYLLLKLFKQLDIYPSLGAKMSWDPKYRVFQFYPIVSTLIVKLP